MQKRPLGFNLHHDNSSPTVLTVDSTLDGFIGQVEETIAALRADGNGSELLEANLDAANDLLDLLRQKKTMQEAMESFLQSPLAEILMPGQTNSTKPERRIGFRATERE